MFRIDHPSASAVLPAPAAAGTPGYFISPAVGSGGAPTVVTADYLNMLQEELMAIVLHAGIAPDKTDHAQVLAALLSIIGSPASASDIWAAVNNTKFITALGQKQAVAFQALSDASTITWSVATQGPNVFANMAATGRIIAAPTGMWDSLPFIYKLGQPAGGGCTPVFDSYYDFTSTPSVNTGANKVDYVIGIHDATRNKGICTYRKSA